MKKFSTLLLVFLLVFSGCSKKTTVTYGEENAEFTSYLDTILVDTISPTDLSINYYFINPEDFGITPELYELGFPSREDYQEWIDYSKDVVAELQTYEDNELSKQQSYDRDALIDYFQLLAQTGDFYDFETGNGTLGYARSMNVQFPVYLEVYTFRNEQDVLSYLNLLKTIADDFRKYAEFEVERQANGTGFGQEELDEIIRLSQDTVTAAQADDYFLINSFDSKIDAVDFLDASQKETYKTENKQYLQTSYVQAYQHLVDILAAIDAPETRGIANKPGGKEYYEYAFQAATGSAKTIEEVKAYVVAKQTAVLKTIQKYLASNPEYINMVDEDLSAFASGEELVQFLENSLENDFPAINDVKYELRKVDDSMSEGSSPAFYFSPPSDYNTSENQYIYINGDFDNSLYTTYAHEGFPGHMYQFNYFLTLESHPIRDILTLSSNAEGWANYAEKYAVKYVTDEDYAAFYAAYQQYTELAYIEMDIGINYDNWDLTAFTEYIYDNFGDLDADIIKETYVYFAHLPAVYPTYYISTLYIEDLKTKMQDALGSTYSDLLFHQVFLDSGSTSFDVIETHIDAYIEANK